MDFQSEVLQKVKGEFNLHERACGIMPTHLMKISDFGGKVFSYEIPDLQTYH